MKEVLNGLFLIANEIEGAKIIESKGETKIVFFMKSGQKHYSDKIESKIKGIEILTNLNLN